MGAKWSFYPAIDHSSIMSNVRPPIIRQPSQMFKGLAEPLIFIKMSKLDPSQHDLRSYYQA
jgi:hypothetical protein